MSQIVRTQVRIPDDLMDWVKQKAKQENRSMNAQLVVLLNQLKQAA